MNRKKYLTICDDHNLASALYKTKKDIREYYGYLTPSEFLALIDSGDAFIQKQNPWRLWEIEQARKDKKEGMCCPRLCFFQLKGKLLELWEKNNPDRFDPKLMK